MEIKKIEHIGIAVKNLEDSIKFYEEILGLKCYSVEEIKDQNVKTAFFMVGQTKIELLESTKENSAIAKFIDKKGEGIHHIAFEIDDLSGGLKEIEKKGISLIDKNPRRGAEGLNIAFLHPASSGGVLVELCQ
jgi:methylmalonyl-CoA/ethylmalonyl-CoA epimerase